MLKRKRWLCPILIIVLIFAVLVMFYNLTDLFSFNHNEEKHSMIITERIEKLCDLATVRYNYQEILDYSDALQFGNTELPFIGKKKILIIYQSYINGGCKLIDFEKVDKDSVRIQLSKGQILDNVLVLDSVNIYDVQQDIFNKFNIGDDMVLINEDMKKYAAENEEKIVRTAEENAAELITGFMQSLGYSSTEIVFR